MCKHILNAQVAIRSPCCEPSYISIFILRPQPLISVKFNSGRKWFDCAECHQEQESHALAKATEMVFACKKCKKCFRKDAAEFEESDEYCPHCDNHFVIDAVTPKPALQVEGEDARIDSRMLKDDRVRGHEERSLFTLRDTSDHLG
ncbi:uncharacterized protein ATNIH1004_009661 [Aspergillus tanneri]|uniref:Uncharacterized protein n=1 Tax=Aspergillus tanneri TaxID=1220188 RepID=A0A5M9MBU3_9EURO|nr:uncharacterized protein ATNIH1004_009661 [Aspergillus tanneri]KAA8642900.1 hypothetical protein ATNIH1004_009661 [Aspergillus tanneri]